MQPGNITYGEDTLMSRAQSLAIKAHEGQYRRDGVTPYVKHAEDVVRRLSHESDIVIAAAWLHDVLEDTETGTHSFRFYGVSESVIKLVETLTHLPHENYMVYIGRVARDPAARKIKIADILSNLADDPTPRQIEKYAKALLILNDHNLNP